MEDLEGLKCCKIFGELNERELEEVAKLATVEKRGAGSRVIAERGKASMLYLVKEGKVAIRMTSRDGHEVTIDELGPGELFGWSAVLDHPMFTAAVWTLEDSTFILFDGQQLRRLFEVNNHIGYRVMKSIADVISSRLENLRARLVDQPFKPEWLTSRRFAAPPATSEKSEMRSLACPECQTMNVPFAVVNETEQYRCKNCGMIYYSPVGCETGPLDVGRAKEEEAGTRLGENWMASPPGGK